MRIVKNLLWILSGRKKKYRINRKEKERIIDIVCKLIKKKMNITVHSSYISGTQNVFEERPPLKKGDVDVYVFVKNFKEGCLRIGNHWTKIKKGELRYMTRHKIDLFILDLVMEKEITHGMEKIK